MSEVGETLAEPDPPSIATEAGGRRSIKIDLLQSAALISFARVDFWCFVELMFPVLYPGQDWSTRATSRPSRRASWGGEARIPQRRHQPAARHMKSALASVLYPAWRLGCDPTVKFICISYGDDLAHDLFAQTRKIIRLSSPMQLSIRIVWCRVRTT
jgi:hypothetical protein